MSADVPKTNPTVRSIAQRLSLRPPQARSLEILDRVMSLAQPHRQRDVQATQAIIRSKFPSVEEFERSFPNLCFALATGVGKTRLMGAFIAYLHLAHGIRHFFVLAPNLTIYDKLVTDFTRNTPKYVFDGIAELAVRQPEIITGDNYERSELLLTTDPFAVTVFIFNIAKFNTRSDEARKTKRLSEYLGTSFMQYLAGLDDLVLIMDEAHRYRADTSMSSIAELQPILGLELTATPQVEAGRKAQRFNNIIYEYPLAQAMRDGFVKEPAVATRKDFRPEEMSPAALERLKLEDGVRIHESTKVDLEVYAHENNVRRVKPFMLVIASDTEHANRIVQTIESDEFFKGRYRGRVIQVHSGQRGAEKDDNIARLLAVEKADEATEIVVHVNMLKEGWDVTNLYTIVPLRAADSRTLVEQSIGRGLRLPYGVRTGVPAVDRLTIVAHDRFQEIVEEASRKGFSFCTVNVGEDVPEEPKQTIVAPPVVETTLGLATPEVDGSEPSRSIEPAPLSRPQQESPERVATVKAALDAIRRATRDPKVAPGPKALESAEVQDRVLEEVVQEVTGGQIPMYAAATRDELACVVREVTEAYVKHTIAIPRVMVLPKGEVRAGYREFTLDLSALKLEPLAREIEVRHLVSDASEFIGGSEGDGHHEARLEDYVVRALIDYDDVSYDDDPALLYNLAEQVVRHFQATLKSDDEVRNVLSFFQRKIASLVHAQMQAHAWEEAASYEVVVGSGFSELRPQAFAAPAGEGVRSFKAPPDNKVGIRNMLFGGFAKCLYPTQKFDSDTERRLAVVLERDGDVLKWFKPGKGVFQIRYLRENDYEPDFVVETKSEKLLCEPKRADQLQDPTVLAKARAAALWCKHATSHELAHDGKPWRYLLIPHDAIADNMTISGLAKRHTFAAEDE